ncbi:DUF1573 domain-containing protein [Flavobacterium sp.]|uniref:DUF1573 domain-containing protein n=1 Tax=Flavobacterium sp. TaxID=239 RepID=UPI0037507292
MNILSGKQNKIIAILILVLLIAVFYKKSSSTSQTFNYKFEPMKIDIGVKKKTEKSIARFKLLNFDDQEISIERVTPGCHCTVIRWSKDPIKKNSFTIIEVEYDNKNPGFFSQKTKVFIKNDITENEIIIKGRVID